MVRLGLGLLFLGSCRTGLLLADPVVGTIENRARGECFSQCLNGLECDSDSGLCVENPCAGKCTLKRCDRTLPVARCK